MKKIFTLFAFVFVLTFTKAQPVASVNPASFSKTFNLCFDSQSDSLFIFNTGSSDLTYNLNKGYGINYDSTSSDNYSTSPASTFHDFYTVGTTSDSVFFTITLNGDYDNANEYADLIVDGVFVTTLVDGNLPNGTDMVINVAYTGATVANWLTDGILNVELRNTNFVGTYVGTELHRVRVRTNGATWTSVSSTSGTVAAGDTAIITVTFNGANLGSGVYTSSIKITTNDGANPQFIIPTSMTINGYPEINLSATCITFDTLQIFETQTKSVTISNTGCDPLTISSMTKSLAQYSLDTTSAMLEVGNVLTLNVTFSPTTLGSFIDTVRIFNDAVDTFVCLTGVAVDKPVMTISPTTMNVTLNSCDDSTTVQLVINNTGAGNLIINSITTDSASTGDIGIPLAATCAPTGTKNNCCGMGIFNVTFNTINNTTIETDGRYNDYSSSLKTSILPGKTYSISIITGTSYDENVRVWIDYNNDGDFNDGGEQVFESLNVRTNHSGNINIPTIVVANQPLRMRVASDYIGSATPTPCSNPGYGQDEDYTVYIIDLVEIQFANDTASQQNPIAAACTPTIGAKSNCCGMGISNVSFNTINNTTVVTDGRYNDYSSTQGTNVVLGQSYTLSVQTGNAGYTEYLKVWIDWNNNGSFADAGEEVFSDVNYINHSGTITVPSDAVMDTGLRMRVSSDYNGSPVPTDCSDAQYGQTEDYTIFIPHINSIANGDSLLVNFKFKSAGLANGVYTSNYIVSGNDPQNPSDTVFTTLTINGTADLTFSNNCIAFDTIMEFLSNTKTIMAYNNGCDTLVVSSITNANSIFTLDTTSFTLMPFDSILLTATFSPINSGTFTDTFSFTTNIGTKTVCLSGTAFESPLISTNPDSLAVTLTGCNDSVTAPLTIYNTGVADLIVDLSTFSQQIKSAPCTPITTGTCCNMGIYNVTFNTINNSTGNATEGFKDYTATQSTTILRGQTYPVSVTTNSSGYNEHVRIWIDFNNNGSFEADEKVFEMLNTYINHTGSITIPATANPGILRMRVGSEYYNNAAPEPCNNVQYGQFEDYAVVIQSGISLPSSTVNDTVATSAASCAPITTGYCCGMGIFNVNFNNINNSSADGSVSYEDFSATQSTRVNQGQSYTINVTTGTTYSEDVRAWIDFNDNGDFADAGEQVFESLNTFQNHSGTISIPDNAVTKRNLRMRVGSDYYPNATPQPCTNVQYGQFEDYTVLIIPKDTIASGDSMTVNIIFEAENLVSGTYINYISIASNDPQNPTITVPATLTLIGSPEIVLTKTCLDLDSIMQYTTSTDTFFIYNNGCDTLVIDSIGNDLSVFTHNINSANILPWDSQMIVVTFSPTTNGTFNDILFISNNDIDTMVCLVGKSFLSPLMTVNPKNLSATLSGCNDTINKTFKIINNGSSPLNYNLDGDIGYNQTSTIIMTATGQRTDHIFTNIGQTDSILLTIKLNGDYSASFEYADLYIDNNFIGQIPDGDIGDGLEIVANYVFLPSQFSTWLSDDTLLVSIQNNGNVQTGFGDDMNQVNVRANGLGWMNSVSSSSGSINPSDSVTITTTFRASGLVSGIYTGQIFVNNNDPFNPADTVNCTLTLVGAPFIALSASCLDLDSIMQNTSNTKSLTIYNDGCDTLNVTSITNALSIFTKDTNNFVILPFDSATLNITFSPTSAGTFLDSLRIFNNDVNKVVCLMGDAFPQPTISINPDSFNVVLTNCNDSTTRTLTIYNTGGSDLIFTTNENGAGSTYDSTIAITYFVSDATTNHLFTNLPYNDSLYLTVTLNGDYDSGGEYAEVYVDGTYIELIPDGDPGNGTNIIRNYAFGGSQVNTWLADGQVTVSIDNTSGVNTGVGGTDNHTARVIIPGISWLEVSPVADTTAASDSSTLVLEFNSTGVTAGTHTGTLYINSNDPQNPTIQIPLTLTVSGSPVLSVSQNCLAHDTIMELTTSVKNFSISNTGCDTLFITSATTNTAFFSANAAGFFVAPLSNDSLPITFAPNAAGNFADTLFIQTNDIDTAICLTGVAFGMPIISANPNPVNVTSNSCDDTTNFIVKIYNTGASNLNYNINKFFGTPEPAPCTPATLSYCCGNGIYNVTLNGMNFSSGDGADGYKDYSDSIGTIFVPGNVYNLLVTTGPNNNERTKMWIDWNNNGIYDGGEFIMDNTNFLPNRVHSVFFAIPASAVKNVPLRMRIGTEDAANANFFDCNDVTNGQFEDYSILVMSVAPTVGTVVPDDSTSVTMNFISTNLPSGSYSGNLVISTNSPTQSEFTLPYTFNINGFASISLSELCVDFDTVAVNATKTDTVTIYNTGGCDTLFVTSVTTGTSEFTDNASSLTILPSDSGQVEISFTPTSVGNFTDTLFITSSAGDTTVCLSGIAKGAPVIVVIPDTLSGTVACGDSVTLGFWVKNIGIDTLIFNISDTTTWANFSSLNGTLAPGDSASLSVEFNSTAIGIGFYSESAVITSNDLSNPSLNLILNFTITSYPFAPNASGASACELSPIPPLTASGTNIQWYADALHTTFLFAGDTFNTGQTFPGVYTYYVTQIVNGCESIDTSVSLTISDASNAATSINASADSICNGNFTMLNVVGGSLGAGGNWVWYADSCGGTSVGTGDTITVSPNVNTDYFVRAEDACGVTACVSKTIIVNTSAPPPIALDTAICGGGSVPPLTASGFLIKWYSDPGTTILLATGNSFNTGQTADGTYNYYVTQTLGGCESPADTSTLIIGSSSVAAASINSDLDTICIGNSVSLSVVGGTLGTNAQWKWYSGSCGGTLVDSGISITVSPSATTDYFVRAEGFCNTTSCVSKNIFVNGSAPAPPAASDTVGCENGVIPDLTATGTNVKWYFDAAATTLLETGNSFATGQTTPGIFNYFVTQTVAGCESPVDTVTLTIYSISVAATSINTSDDSICNGNSVTLSVAGGTLGTGADWKWYDAGCGSNLVGTGNSISVSPSATTTYFVRAESICDTTSCQSITINLMTASTAATSISAADDSICLGNSVLLSVVGGTLGSGANWKWYDVSCGNNLAGTGTSLLVAPTVTTTYFVRAEGICDTTVCQSITITVISNVVAPTASDVTSCTNALNSTLTAAGSNIKWYDDVTLTNLVFSGSSYTTGITSSGTYTFYATQTIGGCEGISDTVILTINDTSVAATSITASDDSVCVGTTVSLSVNGGTLGTNAQWKWFTGTCSGTLIDSGNVISVTPAATTTYFVKAVGTCNTTICRSVTIVVNTTPPSKPAAKDTMACFGGTIPDLTATGSNIKWYFDAAKTTLLATGSSYATNQTAVGNYNYFATQTVGGCESAVDTATLIINSLSVAATSINTSDDSICNGNSVLLSVVGGTLGTNSQWKWYTGSCGGTLIDSGATLTVSPTSTTTYFVRAEGFCGNTSCQSITIKLMTASTAATSISAADDSICIGNSVTLSISGGSLGSGANWKWYDAGCGSSLIGTGTSILVSPSFTTTYFARAEGICNTTVCQSKTITVIGTVAAPSASDVLSCTNALNNTLTATGSNIKWYDDVTLTNLVFSGSSYNTGITASGIYTFYATQTVTGCEGISDTVILTINDSSVAATSINASDDSICSGNSVTLSVVGGTLGTNSQWKWYTGSCGGTLIDSGATLTVSPTSTITYFVRAEGFCGNTACQSITIKLMTASTAATSISAADDSICIGSSVTLSITGGTLGSGASWKWYDAGCGSSLIGTGTSILVSPSSTTTYFARAEGICNTTVCQSKTITVINTVAAPTASDVLSCTNALNNTLTAAGSNIKWYDDVTLTNLVFSGSSYNTGITSSGTYTFYATQTVTGCEGISDTVILTINDSSVAATSINASDDSICSGNSVTLSVVGGTLGTSAQWTWYSGSCGGTLIDSGTTISVSPAITTTYFVRAEGLCGNTSCQSITIKLMTASTAATSISAADDSICIGSSVTLSISGGSLGSGANWKWYDAGCGSSLIGTGTSILVSPSSTTTYFARAEGLCNTSACQSKTITVIGTVAAPSASDVLSCTNALNNTLTATGSNIKWYDDILLTNLVFSGNTFNTGITVGGAFTFYATQSIGGCEGSSETVILTINDTSARPTSIIASDDTICPGNSATLSVNGGSLGTAAQWKWYSGSCGGTLIDSGNAITVSPSVNTNYFVRAEGLCNTTLCRSITIAISTTPPSKPTAKDTVVCFGNPIPNLTATGSNIKWYLDAGKTTQLSSGSSFSTGQTSPGTYNYYATQTVGGCESEVDTATLTIHSISVPAISITAADDSICLGSSVTLAVNGGMLGVGAQWKWFTGSCGGTLIDSGTAISVSPTTTTTYFVRAEGTCNTTICRSRTITVNSTIPPAPTAKDTTVCFGSTIPNLTATGSNIKWYADAGLTNLLFSGNSFATGQTNAGIYTYYATQTVSGCESSSDTAMLTINPQPFVTVFANPSNINKGDTSILMAFNAVSYVWTPSATLSSSTGATVKAFPDTTTTYTVTGTDGNGCMNTATVTVTVGFTGIAGAAMNDGIFIYPNPTADKLNIKIENAKLRIVDCELRIVDVLGKEVYFSKLQTPDSELNLADYADGMYFLQIKTEKGQEWFKVVVEK